MKSALFVDFDNVFSGLRKLDPNIAERFALRPSDWIDWLMHSLRLPDDAPMASRRRLLVRRCYLNPQAFQRFRPAFNRAGFEIVDCPAMTSEGKTSTDIHMVLDIIDLLQHEVHYDEFIVFSADADFTPVLRKLRRWDRRTTVLAVGFPSAAYKASADLLIDNDAFVRDALGISDDDEPRQSVDDSTSPAVDVSRALLQSRASETIKTAVANATSPVPLARLATTLRAQVQGLGSSNWAGFGVFKTFVESLELSPLSVIWTSGGHVRDPLRHALPSEGTPVTATTAWGLDSEMLTLAQLIHDATDTPLLHATQYRALIDGLAEDLKSHTFQINETGKRVRDVCRNGNHGVSRADVTFVLRGLAIRGHVFGANEDDRESLARRFAEHVLSLCLREQMVISDRKRADLFRWITGIAAPHLLA